MENRASLWKTAGSGGFSEQNTDVDGADRHYYAKDERTRPGALAEYIQHVNMPYTGGYCIRL